MPCPTPHRQWLAMVAHTAVRGGTGDHSVRVSHGTGATHGGPASAVLDHGAPTPWRRHTVTLLGFWACVLLSWYGGMYSLAILPLRKEFGWSDPTAGVVFSCYFAGYAPFQLVSGFLAHKYGGPLQILCGLSALGALSAITPVALHGARSMFGGGHGDAALVVLCVIRFWQGVGGAMLNPGLHRLISRWAPVDQRSIMHNCIYSGQTAGTVGGLVIGAVVISGWGWPAAMYTLALAAGVWAAAWFALVSDAPDVPPAAYVLCRRRRSRKAAESGESAPLVAPIDDGAVVASGAEEAPPVSCVQWLCQIPWRHIVVSVPFWAIMVNHWCFDYGGYTISTWLPTYLDNELGFDLKHSGNLAALPSGVMCIIVLGSGALATAVISRGLLSVTAVRKVWQSIGMFTPAVMLLLVGLRTSRSVVGVMALLVVSTGMSGFCLCGHHVNHIDIAPRHASVLYGITNTFANTSGVIGPIIVGRMLGKHPKQLDWSHVFFLTAAVQALGGVVWVLCASGNDQGFPLHTRRAIGAQPRVDSKRSSSNAA